MAKKNIEKIEEVEVEEAKTFSPKDLAAQLDTDPKSFRRWLRRHTDSRAGKGGRWSFDAETAEQLINVYRNEAKAEADSDDSEVDTDEAEAMLDELEELEG